MPKSDTWPGGVAMESLSNMDSAGSCDSVISMNSGYSEDSMEHLSAEERACLMYLEETIEALEVQEDSGLSNDEPDSVLQAEKMGRMSATDISSFTSESRSDLKPDKAELHALNQTLDLQSSPASTANMKDVKTSVNLMTQPKPPVTESATGCEIHPPATQSEVLCLSKDGDGNIKIISSNKLSHSQTSKAPEIDLGLIPPPSDFRDEPSPPPRPEKAKNRPPSAGISGSKPGATIDLEQLRQRASAKRTSVTSPVTQEPPNKPPELSPVAFSSVPQMSPPPESTEPRSPPAVAPKPKKLPASIILKSHKAGAVAEGNSGLPVPPSSDRLLLDPQRVRLEALRKLGLLKSAEADTSPILSPKHSPKTRRSWAAPSSPVSPAAPQTPPMTPSYTRLSNTSPVSIPPQSPVAVSPSGPATAPAAVSPSGPATAPAAVSPSGPATAPAAVSLSGPATAPAAVSPSGPATAPAAVSPSGPATAPAAVSPSGPAIAPAAVSPSGPATAPAAVSPSGPAIAPAAVSPSGPATAPAAVSPSGPATAPAAEPPDFIPAPPAFSDPDGPLLSDDEPTAVKDLSEATANAWANMPPHTPPSLVKQLTPPKVKSVKSATLERSGLGLGSYMVTEDYEADQGISSKQSLSQLRNNRPRPASLGSGKEFSGTQGEVSQVGSASSNAPDLRRSLPAVQHSGDSQKLPRSQGISVLICPRAQNGDDRRKALKRLGLLRD